MLHMLLLKHLQHWTHKDTSGISISAMSLLYKSQIISLTLNWVQSQIPSPKLRVWRPTHVSMRCSRSAMPFWPRFTKWNLLSQTGGCNKVKQDNLTCNRKHIYLQDTRKTLKQTWKSVITRCVKRIWSGELSGHCLQMNKVNISGFRQYIILWHGFQITLFLILKLRECIKYFQVNRLKSKWSPMSNWY